MNILIIDKFPVFRKGLSCYLKDRFATACIQEASDPRSVPVKYLASGVALVFLGVNGRARCGNKNAIAKIRSRYSGAKLIIYDENAELILGLSYLKFGSHAYVSKKAALSELNQCLVNLLAGKRYISKEVFNVASMCVN
ncbi:hypothetical protein [Dyadobacter diqingensis]|uniref:hypothetical protein n=1 Tax=Dyadobacter diqingensis TaxID=2938121 RepID=UPI0020C48785|nr:hypothetical protein [Dyadobacter diqingensis]